jgi:uronate dehydrogenase
MKTLLITGAAGGVGSLVRPLLRHDYRLRLSDRVPVADLHADETFALAELGDAEALARAIRGVDGILHLGGYSLEADWQTILPANIEGAYNVFETARREGVRRIVFASSNHVVGFYPRAETIPVEATLRPDSRYGVSKAFGEALAGLYAYKYGAEVLTIRIGHIMPKPANVRDLAIWLSPRDFCQLVRIGMETPGLRHETIYGISDNKRAWWDNSAALSLGYRPEDRSEDYADVVAGGEIGDPRGDLNQGGVFCVVEDSLKPPSAD